MKILLTILGSLLLLNVSAQQYNPVKTNTDPVAGKRVTLSYLAEGLEPSVIQPATGTVYFYTSSKQSGQETFTLKKSSKSWNGTVSIPDSTVMLSFVFTAGDGKTIDNNQRKGYLFPVYKKGKPVQFAYAQMAYLLGGGPPDAAGLKKDQKQALIFMKEEIRIHPESEVAVSSSFYNMLANSPEREDKVDLLKRLKKLKSDKEEELMMAQLYLSYFGGKKEADSLDKLLTERFPDGKYIKEKKLAAERITKQSSVAAPVPTAPVAAVVNKAEILKNVTSSLVDEPTAPVTLKDINGNPVTLGAAELKGKVIVVDFWATWCKPCIASFPAMEKVMAQYKDNPSVKFFFICTLEQGDALHKVKEFLAKNPYPFTVLMDEKTDDMNLYKAYSNYKMSGGIPAKVIIDGKGHVRARTAGFSGNGEELITELSAMIDIALKTSK